MIPGTVVWSRPRTPDAVGDAHDLDDRAVGRFVTLPSFGQVHREVPRLAGDHAVEQLRDELARRHARDVGRVAHLLVVLDVVVGVGAVARHAVVVHAPVAAVVVAGVHEARA